MRLCVHLAALLFGLGAMAMAEPVVVRVTNELPTSRPAETIELDWKTVAQRLPNAAPASVTVRDTGGAGVLSQCVDEDGDGTFDKVIFQAAFAPSQSKSFTLSLEAPPAGPAIRPLVQAMFVPQRKDDFAWENDRIAFRMYGPALQATGEITSGLDIWAKHVPDLIVKELYDRNDYHRDHGKGVDCYSVGKSCGAGGVAIWANDKLVQSKNFKTWKILANGPIRCIFQLDYEPWDAGGTKVSETKRISLDAGSQLNRMQSTFSFEGGKELTVATAIVVHKNGQASGADKQPWIGVWEPADGKDNGMLGLGVVIPPRVAAQYKQAQGHAMLLVPVKSGQPLVYWAGGGWSKANFADADAWKAYLADYARRLGSPLRVEW